LTSRTDRLALKGNSLQTALFFTLRAIYLADLLCITGSIRRLTQVTSCLA
jgi:hypothetical protein